jgi:hypothetical protein
MAARGASKALMSNQEAEEFLGGLGCNAAQIKAIQAYYDRKPHRRITRLLAYMALAVTSYTFLILLYILMLM